MDDLNLRQQVAERLGWTDIHRSSTTPSMIGMIPPTASGKRIGPFNIPVYDSDIAAAWTLTEGMACGIDNFEGVWRASLGDGKDAYAASAPTAPAAICKAWLAYMESKHE